MEQNTFIKPCVSELLCEPEKLLNKLKHTRMLFFTVLDTFLNMQDFIKSRDFFHRGNVHTVLPELNLSRVQSRVMSQES